MTAPQEAGGPWLDMSRYPDTDPDAALSPADHDLLTSALTVDEGELPDSVWEHMLAVVTGEDGTETDDPTGESTDEPVDDWSTWDPEPDHPDEPADDPGHDPTHDGSDSHDGHDWDGGAV